MTEVKRKIAILGGGNIGLSIANGLAGSQFFKAEDIIVTRRRIELLSDLLEKGFNIGSNNRLAVQIADIIIIAVLPQQLNHLLEEIKDEIDPSRHMIISVVSGATIGQIKNKISKEVAIVRAMPNTAIAIGESMTCLSASNASEETIGIAKQIFDSVGKTLVIEESLMVPATALCACGIAFFLRAIRAASQGGIEIGFHAEDALLMASQTAKGAASLLLSAENHPESEVDKVTTPMGCTISGLNQMEHNGFSSALIKGIVTSAEKAAKLYSPGKEEK
ncbi:MAG: pyrroline-5-carboxylate reductase [Bacteroidota bacterium]|nr:pyrroline-5-carboxylate reductase [Bacteroidota bacterium]MDP4194739.1 pyrroline-5-carboxylate reductase [Bacteroidota bacterium]